MLMGDIWGIDGTSMSSVFTILIRLFRLVFGLMKLTISSP